MKKFIIYLMCVILYAVGYNIIEHGGELLFFVGLAVVIGFIFGFEKAFQEGFRLLPENETEKNWFDTYFMEE